MSKEIDDLKKRLKQSEEIVKKLKGESSFLRKAIWDMLNYAQMYVLILDSNLIIRLINWSLATDLGFENERDVIGCCWLEFVPSHTRERIIAIHDAVAHNVGSNKYREVTSDLYTLSEEIIPVKWFNTHINSHYNMTFSMGIKVPQLTHETALTISEDSIRSYYRDIIKKDRTMIQSLKDVIIDSFEEDDNLCNYDEE